MQVIPLSFLRNYTRSHCTISSSWIMDTLFFYLYAITHAGKLTQQLHIFPDTNILYGDIQAPSSLVKQIHDFTMVDLQPFLRREYSWCPMSIKHHSVWSCSRPRWNLPISLFVGSRAESGASGFKLTRSTTDGYRACLHPDRPAKHLHHISRVKGSRSKRNTLPGYQLHPPFQDTIRRNVKIACFTDLQVHICRYTTPGQTRVIGWIWFYNKSR